MNKLFKMLQESFGSAPQRNGFDLSRREIFSTKVGIKVPCFALETVPNDYHEIRPVNLIRTLPFNEANFVRMKQYLDFYYVPFTALMTNFHEYVQQTTDPVNSLLVGQNVEKTFPVYPLDALLLAVFLAHEVEYHVRQGTPGAFDLQTFLNSVDGSSIGAATDVYNEYTELCEIFIRKSSPAANPSLVEFDCVRDMFNNPIYRDVVRLLDMLGYGNYLNVISYEVDDSNESGFTNYFYHYAGDLIRLVRGKSINLFRLCAYQCVYQNFGINTVYDKLNVYSFNLDDVVRKIAESGVALGWLSRKDVSNSYDVWWKVNSIFSIHYSQWKKDIFTAAYPDSQFGGVSVVSVNYSVGSVGSAAAGSSRYPIALSSDGSAAAGSNALTGYNREVLTSFDILDLRRAEALQGWKEDMMRSGFRAKQRQKSQFGVAPSFDPHCMPYVIGSVSSDIAKDTVTGTSGDQFAELAATGMSTLGKDVIKFDGTGRNDFGIIIGLLSVVPDADYDAIGLDSHNIKVEPFDFYTPAFQNIGLQPLPVQVLNNSRQLYSLRSGILGYVPRYYDYKQAVDKVHGEFCTFTARPNADQAVDTSYVGQFRSYVSTRYDMENLGLSRLNSLYVNPAIVDDIFKVIVDGDNRQSTDQFMVNAYFDVKSVRPMSILGLPRW